MEVHSWQQQLSHNYSSRQEAGYNMPSNRSSLSNHSLVDMLRMVGNSIHCSSHSQQVDNQVALLANLLDRHNLLKTQAQTISQSTSKQSTMHTDLFDSDAML